MNRQELPRILCVDDESRVVEGLVLHLRRDYQVFTASSGAEALKTLKQMGGAAVVVSALSVRTMPIWRALVSAALSRSSRTLVNELVIEWSSSER